QRLVVRREDARAPGGGVRAHERDQRVEPARVEAIVGLVEDEQGGRAEERGAEARAPALAERHPLERDVRELVEAERVGERGGRRRDAAARGAQRPQLGAGEEPRRVGALGYVAEGLARARALAVRAPHRRAAD